MSKKKKAVEEFFSMYENQFNSGLATDGANIGDEIGRSFADCFVESTPAGVRCANRDTFANKVRDGFNFYKGIGSKSMTIVSKDISLLDDLHAMAKVYWKYDYEKEGKSGSIDFHVIYFLTFASDNLPKIFAYVAGDEQKVLREKGLIPENEMAHEEA